MKLNLREIASAVDQRDAILSAVTEAVAGIDVMRNRVLIATYVIPEKTSGGIIRIDKTLEESRYQGKVGLILKKGPAAFKFDSQMDKEFPSVEPAVGDWVFYRAADTWECGIAMDGDRANGISCRYIYDDLIVGRIANPDAIY